MPEIVCDLVMPTLSMRRGQVPSGIRREGVTLLQLYVEGLIKPKLKTIKDPVLLQKTHIHDTCHLELPVGFTLALKAKIMDWPCLSAIQPNGHRSPY